MMLSNGNKKANIYLKLFSL